MNPESLLSDKKGVAIYMVRLHSFVVGATPRYIWGVFSL
ncbi:hypothetical protein M113_0343 [Bacteroides fragilis str. 3986 N3]|nr:hypothetical protein M111_0288 [Bacteroides fragilis str. 3986T(B)10]EYA59138.1 hypothetical protein M112_0350 [Bacteroides fragilis str. 3986 T(B)13]EYE70689.1 hypothetical protein M113_0343 [Bacteroides fragilis str. 3986 N3]